jgi:hypothetical protein
MGMQYSGQAVHFRPRKPKVLTQFDRSAWTVQIEYRLPWALPNVHVSGTMIVRIGRDPNAAEAEHRRHDAL